MLFHSAQKSCQEATWEFPETEIELVLTQPEQKAEAETWIIVLYKALAARRTQRHVCHHVFKGAYRQTNALFFFLLRVVAGDVFRRDYCTELFPFYLRCKRLIFFLLDKPDEARVREPFVHADALIIYRIQVSQCAAAPFLGSRQAACVNILHKSVQFAPSGPWYHIFCVCGSHVATQS